MFLKFFQKIHALKYNNPKSGSVYSLILWGVILCYFMFNIKNFHNLLVLVNHENRNKFAFSSLLLI